MYIIMYSYDIRPDICRERVHHAKEVIKFVGYCSGHPTSSHEPITVGVCDRNEV